MYDTEDQGVTLSIFIAKNNNNKNKYFRRLLINANYMNIYMTQTFLRSQYVEEETNSRAMQMLLKAFLGGIYHFLCLYLSFAIECPCTDKSEN